MICEIPDAAARKAALQVAVLIACCLLAGCGPSKAHQEWLETVYLEESHVGPSDLPASELPHAKEILLNSSEISDAAFAQLEYASNVHYIGLDFSSVQDRHLVHFEKLHKLESLGLQGTLVTEEGVAKLQQKLPQTRITYYRAPSPRHRRVIRSLWLGFFTIFGSGRQSFWRRRPI